MSRFQTMDLFEPSSFDTYRQAAVYGSKPSLLLPFTSPFLVEEEELGLGFSLDLLNPKPKPFDLIYSPPSPFEVFETAINLIQVEKTPVLSALKRYQERRDTDLYLQYLSDRVSALELGFDQALNARKASSEDRKYKWTAEYKGPQNGGVEKKYKWLAEIKQAKGKDGKLTGGVEKSFKWTSAVKGRGMDAPISKSYTFKSTTAPACGVVTAEKPKKKKGSPRLVEIEEPADPAALALKQIFEKRSLVIKNDKGKKKELSRQDAALIIQVHFRAHLVHRSQALRGLRELAVAKAKLKELRAHFNNFSYRRRIASDTVERQRFSEKIIVLLLTVDAIEGVDYMVRSAQRSMVAELEAMLDAVDPQPPGKLGSLKRRKFDLPEACPIQKEMALGVSQVMQMLDQSDNGSSAIPDAS
ncbi:BAG family molecular chaperone regulator 7-like [Aristolochia californica]|uniref:BAG family molecular chaperone regulator 7-like n=1 Tax=Aristolochia californica TaxID=171875 RepID=UPI0035D72FB1